MKNKPNILMIVVDQEFAHQSIPEEVNLPNRDRLRSQGVTFNNQQVTHGVYPLPLSDVDRTAHTLHEDVR
jgi:arylsulfatase A-like enzyme